MAGQEGSNNKKCEASIPKFQYKLLDARREMLPDSEDLFKPRVVSLGPVYHKENNLQVTKDDKRKIKDLVLAGKAKDLDSDDEMKIALGKARALYEGEELDADFDEMMKLDACFIIHAIDYNNEGKSEVLDERPDLLPLILEDMFLLENQVPIIVLEATMKVLGRKYPQDIDEFVEKIAQSPKGARTFWDNLMDLPCPIQFSVFLKFQEGSNENEESDEEKCLEQTSGQEPSHLLHLLRVHLLGCSEENQLANTNDNMCLPPRRAAELTDAGIKFQRSPTSSMKDLKFKKGVIYGHLFLPSLAQLTKARLVNLMVYELCQGVSGHGITSYVSFLAGLIKCPADVNELRSTQILPEDLGDDEKVTHFFNSLGTFLAPFAYAYHNVLKEIDSHCHSRWRRSTAKFCNKYFSSPWITVSFLIAILLLITTVATEIKKRFGTKK